MTNQEILTKAIQKAVDGGFHEAHDYTILEGHIYDLDNQRADDLIYWHDFAKALWGDQQEYGLRSNYKDFLEMGALKPGWQYHLQRMVVAEDPIQYLGDNI